MRELQGRVAIVTGGGSGIGRATALALAAEGVRVVVADVRGARAEAVAAEVAAAGSSGVGETCDVTADGAFERLRDRALDAFGRVDIVMSNAAIIAGGLPEAIPLDAWRQSFEVNVFAAVRSNLVFVPLFLGQGEGHLVFTASTNPLYPYSYDRLPYTATKGALVAMAESLALYLRPRNVGVTLLCPGPTATNIGELMRQYGEPVPVRSPGFGVQTADAVAAQLLDAIRGDRFFVLTHPEVRDLMVERAHDPDALLRKQVDRLATP